MEFVSWDDEIPNWTEVIKLMFQTTNPICGLTTGKIKNQILKWRYVSTIVQAIFCGDIPYIGLKNRQKIYSRYLQSIGSWVMAIDINQPWFQYLLWLFTIINYGFQYSNINYGSNIKQYIYIYYTLW